MSKYGVFSGPYFPALGLNTEIYFVFSTNTRKYGPEKTPYLDTFHRMNDAVKQKDYDASNLLEKSKIIIADNLIHNINHF